jgi:hypothetical protein
MKAKYILSSLAILGSIALAAPGFAQDRSYAPGVPAGSLGMDVAPGGGVYTHQDVSSEEMDRMSHPVVGERRAPSNVSSGSLSQIDQTEDSMTAKLNQDQLNGTGEMTATLPKE